MAVSLGSWPAVNQKGNFPADFMPQPLPVSWINLSSMRLPESYITVAADCLVPNDAGLSADPMPNKRWLMLFKMYLGNYDFKYIFGDKMSLKHIQQNSAKYSWSSNTRTPWFLKWFQFSPSTIMWYQCSGRWQKTLLGSILLIHSATAQCWGKWILDYQIIIDYSDEDLFYHIDL